MSVKDVGHPKLAGNSQQQREKIGKTIEKHEKHIGKLRPKAHINSTVDPIHIGPRQAFPTGQRPEKAMAQAELLEAAAPIKALLTSGSFKRNGRKRLAFSSAGCLLFSNLRSC